MAQRGRPRHPGPLTQREQEVLALLREGLTNEGIADRLGISFETAKHHVSQIISKLGVASRQEAAAWQPEAEEGRRWRPTQVALALSGIAVVAAAVAGLALLAWGVSESSDGAGEGQFAVAEGITLEELYANVGRAVPRDGRVLHATTLGTVEGEGISDSYQRDIWIDASRQLARTVTTSDSDDRSVPHVFVNGRDYSVQGHEESPLPLSYSMDCPPGIGVAGLLIGCDEEVNRSTTLSTGQYEGQDVVIMEHALSTTNEDDTPTGSVAGHVYVDTNTWLPIAGESETRGPEGTVFIRGSSEITYEYLSPEDLPDDHFSIEAIGYYEACAKVAEIAPNSAASFECETPGP